jgi:hypothetical protein
VSLLSDIAALKTRVTTVERRTTAVEAKNATQGNSRAALDSRATNLQKEVDALKYIISPTPPGGGDEPDATVTYGAGTITNPNNYADGAVVAGAGIGVTILNGHLDFGSNQEFRDMTIQASSNSATYNKANATGTTFRRCHFRGGGGTGSDSTRPVIALGFNNNCSFITFKDCEVECNLGSNADFGEAYNNLSFDSTGSGAPTDIVMDGCHVGVSNGVRTGSPRMGLECWTDTGAPGWQRITLRNCVFEVCDAHCTDFSDRPEVRSTGVLIEGCTLWGGGLLQRSWGSTIDIEYPLGAVIRNNLLYRSWEHVMQSTTRDNAGYTPALLTFTDNIIDLTTDNGVTPAGYSWLNLEGAGDTVERNTVR